jgi:predicted metal-dependent phosphoesterase TrpH
MRNDAKLRVRTAWYRPCSEKNAMNAGLRADLHVHTREAEPFIAYNAREVIARAAREGYRVLSITNHDTLTFDTELAAFARDRGIVLIPGVEVTVEGRHVLIYNADVAVDKLTTFAGLRRYRTPEWLVVAPHPFFPASYCLREKLWHEIELFDAIEFSHFYTPRLDFNRAAVKLARAIGLPLIGTSDSHFDDQFGTTFSLVNAEAGVESVLAAIKAGRVSVVSRPLSITRCLSIFARHKVGPGRERARTWLRRSPPSPQTILTPR